MNTSLLKKIAVGGLTAITSGAVFEIALIGSRALAEDVGFLSACAKLIATGEGKKVRKLLK